MRAWHRLLRSACPLGSDESRSTRLQRGARRQLEVPTFVGDDRAEAHHDVCVLDEQGGLLARRRLPEGLAGSGQLHALLAEHAADPGAVVIGIESDRGLWVAALLEAGHTPTTAA